MPLLFASILLGVKHAYVRIPYDGTPVALFLAVATTLCLLRVAHKMRSMLHRGGPIVSTHAMYFGGLMADAAVCPDGEADGTAWALRTPGEQVESFIFGRMLDRIAGGHTISADGRTRSDEKIALPEVPSRITAMLDEYRAMGLRAHLAKRHVDPPPLPPTSSAAPRTRPKLPLDAKVPRGRRVMPVSAAAAAARVV
jgi:hypothetical protein